MPTDWMIVAMPEISRSALTRIAMSHEPSPTAGPTMSGTATAPAYMMNRCCSPKRNSLSERSTSFTGCTRVPAGSDDLLTGI
jgi:hypothetical protein